MNIDVLKNSILQMAIQGKLAPQDSNDEPASVLLAKIRAERERLIEEGKIKRPKNESIIFRGCDKIAGARKGRFYEQTGDGNPVDITAELPFEIPENWEWVRMGSIGVFIRGSGLKREDIQQEGVPCVRYGELYTTYDISFNRTFSFAKFELSKSLKKVDPGDVLLTLTGENKEEIGKAVVWLGKGCIYAGGDMAIFKWHGFHPLFLAYLLNSPYAITNKGTLGTGNIIVHISCDKLASILLPLPPLAEQKRIADKLDEIFSHIASYKKKAAELLHLNAIAKTSILQHAIQGKFVPQDPNDEPASVLLEKIRAERERLIEEGKIKRPKTESRIFRRDGSWWEKKGDPENCIDEEIPFEIPESWEWARLGDLVIKNIKRGKSPVYCDQSDFLVFAQKCNVKNKGIDLTLAKFLDPAIIENYPEEEFLLDQDIIINSTGEGTLGRVGLFRDTDKIDNKKVVPDSHVTIIRLYDDLSKNFFFHVLMFNQAKLEKMGEGSTKQTELKAYILQNFLVPLPPLAEQKRIAEKLSQFMDMNEDLKAIL